MKTLNVLYQSSAAYAIPAAVSICSLLENNKDIDTIKIWFIDVGLTEEDRNKLQELIQKYNRQIEFISSQETDDMLSQAGVKLWSGSYATFYKIFVCSRLRNVDKILYIDADTVVLDSMLELCDYDMDGYACAMAGSGMTGVVKQYLQLQNYFNAGIIYFNLKYWREHNVEQDFIDVINSEECYKYTIIGDETLNNYVMRDRIKKLPLKYNFESTWWLWGWNFKLYKKLGWYSPEDCYYTIAEIQEAKNKPCIGHYVDLTTGRPWDYLNDNPFRKEFEQYSELLKPWKTIDFAMRGIGGKNKLIAWIKLLVKKCMPFSLRSRVGFWQHDRYWTKRISEL